MTRLRFVPTPAFTRRLFGDLRREGAGRGREAAALGLGTFIGCLPVFGVHFLVVAVVGRLLGLNRLRMYVAANISNPLMAPLLILAEIQLGAWLRRGTMHDLTLASVRSTDPWLYGADLVTGAVVLGAALGVAVTAATLAAVVHTPALPQHVDETFAAAADRYLEHSIAAWEFGRGKLRRDPVYRALLEGELADGHTLVDIGCGQGLALAALVEARRHSATRHHWPGCMPPTYGRLIGIESRARVARLAARALGSDAEIVHAFAPSGLPERVSAALLLDVLHLMPPDVQEQLLQMVMQRLDQDGVVIIREADAAGGRGFAAVRCGNWLKNVMVGNWRQRYYFRAADEWRALFARQGWDAESRSMREGTPFANVLFRLTRTAPAADQVG